MRDVQIIFCFLLAALIGVLCRDSNHPTHQIDRLHERLESTREELYSTRYELAQLRGETRGELKVLSQRAGLMY